MAAIGSWPNIRQHGLLSTSALLDLFEVDGELRKSLETRKRADSVAIQHPRYGTAIIRDQKPLHESMLARCLRGRVTVEEWLRLLNSRVFFWVDPKRLDDLRQARAYRAGRQTVIFADTRRLVERYEERIRLAHINTGATRSVSHFRDLDTFKKIEDFNGRTVVELTIDKSVPDLIEFVDRVEEIGGGEESRVIWSE